MRLTSLPFVLTALLLGACGEKEPVDSAVDADGDGFSEEEDCDDSDAAVNPGATERCDGVDNNCDGEVDEGLLITVYGDRDGDGYGVTAQATQACAAEAGQAEADGDCDDSSADIHPGAPEEDCTDPVDYNCDGIVEYEDNDSDGYAACVDCDDANSTIHPDADERCDNVDNNCDGEVDEASAIDALTFYADADLDGYGDADNSTVACDAPSGYVADNSDCDDQADSVYPGAPELCDAADSDCDGLIGEVLVPTDYRTIQAAIDAAEPEICVEAGTYYEALDLTTDSSVTLEGVGADQVFLSGGTTDRVLTVTGGDGDLTLRGLTVEDGYANDSYGAGLHYFGNEVGSVYLEDVVFDGHVCESAFCLGAAVYIDSYDHAEVSDVEVLNSTIYGAAYGMVSLVGGQSLDLDGLSIHDNVGEGSSSINSGVGTVLHVQGSSTDSSTGYFDSAVSVNELHVADNVITNGGSAYAPVVFYRVGTLDMTNSSVTGNSSSAYVQCVTPHLFPFQVHTGTYRNVELVGNDCGGGERVYATGFWHYGTGTNQGSSGSLENVIIAGNIGTSAGDLLAGFILDVDATMTYTNVSVHGNLAIGESADAGWLFYRDNDVTLTNVDYSGNSLVTPYAPTYATGFADASGATLRIRYSNLSDLGDTPFGADLTDPTGSNGVISVSPGYTDVSDADPLNWDLTLGSGSDLIDAGDPSIADPDGSISDIGAYGGPGAADW